MIALNKLEKEIILSHLETDIKELHIKQTKEFVCINGNEYKKEKNTIFILNTSLFSLSQNRDIAVYFLYKKVKICFKTILKKEKCIFFEIPEIVFIKNKKKKINKSFPRLSLYSQSLLISTFISSNINYSHNYIEIEKKEKLQEIFNRSKQKGYNLLNLLKSIKQNTAAEENLYSHLFIINKFLQKKEKGLFKQKYLYILSDANIILLFSTYNFAHQLALAENKSKIFLAKISFKNRVIVCNACYSFFSPICAEGKKCENGFLGLKILGIQEEDRRYLYEGIFLRKYQLTSQSAR